MKPLVFLALLPLLLVLTVLGLCFPVLFTNENQTPSP